MISKDEAKAKLRKAGYSVVDDNSVITILVPEKTNIKNVVKNVKELFLKNDYQASFGVRQTSSAINGADDISDNEQDLEESIFDDNDSADVIESESVVDMDDKVLETETSEKNISKAGITKAKASKAAKAKTDEEFFDDEDENPENSDSSIALDEFDMDMLLNEESVQFSLEDFGMM